MKLNILCCALLASAVSGATGSLVTIHGTGTDSTSAGITVTADDTDSAYFVPDSVYVESGASLVTWGPAALGGAGVGGGGDVTVPVELASFNARLSGSGVLLAWQTVSETDHLGFNVLRSADEDKDFVRINGKLVPGSGNAAGGAYSYTDSDPAAGTMYYKLQMVDVNGRTDESGAVAVTYTPAGMGAPPALLPVTGTDGMVTASGLIKMLTGNTGIRLYNAAGSAVGPDGLTAAALPAVFIVEKTAGGKTVCASVLVVE